MYIVTIVMQFQSKEDVIMYVNMQIVPFFSLSITEQFAVKTSQEEKI